MDNTPKPIRLDRYLSEVNAATRSRAKDMIRSGRVTVNGKPAAKPEDKVIPGTDEVCLDGLPLLSERNVWIMLNKPAGVLSASTDKNRETVLDLIPYRKRDLFAVGRLDIDTTGLILITDDGELSHRLLSPKRHCEKVYHVTTDLPIPASAGELFAQGINLGDFISLPALWKQEGEKSGLLTLHEGKFHQVKRMFASLGLTVTALKRVSFAGIDLDESLAPGQSRRLTEEETGRLREAAGK